MSEELFKFRKGNYARKIQELIKREIEESSPYTFKPLDNITFQKVKVDADKYFYDNGEDTYMMFAYLDKYDTLRWGTSPSYHVCECKTRNKHTSFVFGNRMPVKFYDIGTGDYKEEVLKICKNCVKEQARMIFGLAAKGKPWFDYVIMTAVKIKPVQKNLRNDGYLRIWRQLSEAIREKNGYCCLDCGIDLNEDHKRMFLDVHHVNGNKLDNKESNLKSLCAVCHASVNARHKENFMNYTDSKNRLSTFIQFNEDLISNHNPIELKYWKTKLNIG